MTIPEHIGHLLHTKVPKVFICKNLTPVQDKEQKTSQLFEITGTSSSGKTQLIIYILCSIITQYNTTKVFCIDTKNSIYSSRVLEILTDTIFSQSTKDALTILENINMFRNSIDIFDTLQYINILLEKHPYSILVIDSLSYNLDYDKIINILYNISRERNVLILYSCDVQPTKINSNTITSANKLLQIHDISHASVPFLQGLYQSLPTDLEKNIHSKDIIDIGIDIKELMIYSSITKNYLPDMRLILYWYQNTRWIRRIYNPLHIDINKNINTYNCVHQGDTLCGVSVSDTFPCSSCDFPLEIGSWGCSISDNTICNDRTVFEDIYTGGCIESDDANDTEDTRSIENND